VEAGEEAVAAGNQLYQTLAEGLHQELRELLRLERKRRQLQQLQHLQEGKQRQQFLRQPLKIDK
jgi:hypothetical protein